MVALATRLFSPAAREQVMRLRQRLVAPFVSEPYATVLPYTMVGIRRLRKLRELAAVLDRDRIPGDIVECGTCNGGSGALLAHSVAGSPFNRHTFLLDSFEGLPPPDPRDGTKAASWAGYCRGSVGSTRQVLGRLGVDTARTTIIPGWFSETLPTLTVERIALLHIDADWYESVYTVLSALYERVSPGGFLVFDDLGYWEGCAAAWKDFQLQRGLSLETRDIDGVGAFVQVPLSHPEANSVTPRG